MIDSGCTSHLEINEPKFVRFQESFDPQNHYIVLANSQRQQGNVQGVGDVMDFSQDRNSRSRSVLLRDALYIPRFKQDNMSVWKTIQSGHSITFSPNGSTLTTNDGTVFDIVEINKLFYLCRGKQHTKVQQGPFRGG